MAKKKKYRVQIEAGYDYITLVWVNNLNEVHRDDDLPAKIYSDGSMFWYKNGRIHRGGDKPAIICADGNIMYFKNGKQYRPKKEIYPDAQKSHPML